MSNIPELNLFWINYVLLLLRELEFIISIVGTCFPRHICVTAVFTILLELAGGPKPPALIGDCARVLCSDSCFIVPLFDFILFLILPAIRLD